MRASRGGVAAAVAVASMAGTGCTNESPPPALVPTSASAPTGSQSMDAGVRWLLHPRPDCAPPFPIGTGDGAEHLASTSIVPNCQEDG